MDDLDCTSDQKLKGLKRMSGLMGQFELGFLLQDHSLVLIVGDITWVNAGRRLGHVSDPPRGSEQAKCGNGVGRGPGVPDRGASNIEVR
ncbi:hypothetical protein Golax_018283 [Gossypium laxum]|uniref:Uncharacterized protein n=1 Tax=Gossypium laxum TaxID=34288 RepID=A0A7J8Z2T3_9ROSI|nr:hypothetical protein [Gossypium laxum]